MSDDFGEFFGRLGKDVPVYRECNDCGDIIIVNADEYGKPKTVCDPGYCEQAVPFCICRNEVMYSNHCLEKCDYPECPCIPPPEKK